MKAYIKEFEVYLKETKKSSSNTLESYLRVILRRFAPALDRKYQERTDCRIHRRAS